MITDAVYKIGASHRVCQDYALASENAVVVCDGCSSGRHVDVGARVLAHLMMGEYGIDFMNPKLLKQTADSLNLTQQDMTATILAIDSRSGGCVTTRMGDGFIFEKVGDYLTIKEGSWSDNAPYYFAYDAYDMTDRWNEEFPNNKYTETIYTFDSNLNLLSKVVNDKADAGGYISIGGEWDSNEVYRGVASDGLSSFQDANKNPVALDKIVPILFNFKNFNPGFVQRRVQMAEKEFAKLGWSHYDDLSMGVIANAKPV